MGITQELVHFCLGLVYRKLPEEVIDSAKYRLLDFISVACRGSMERSSQTMYRFIKEMDRISQGGVIVGTSQRAPYLFAALANGTASHAVEMDDVNNESSLHPGVAVFSAALAVGEMTGADGKRFIEAVICGYEVMIRLGKAIGPEKSYTRGFHPTGTCGVFGASMTTSKFLRLSEEKTVNAFGIAGSQASGSMEYLAQGAWTKRFHAGWAAFSGMISGQLAEKGFQGPTTIIEGKNGFLHAYSNGADVSKVLEGVGSGFEILRTSVKPHACCRYMQPPIDAVLKIVKEQDLRPQQVKKVRLGLLRAGVPLIAEPLGKKLHPQSIVDAQFSMPFGAAVAILYREAGLSEFTLRRSRSKEVKQMMERIECFINPDLDEKYPKQWGATAEILTESGETYSAKIDYPKGDPENPLSWEEMIDRFHKMCHRLMTREQRLKIVEQVRTLEKIKDLRKWTTLLLRNP